MFGVQLADVLARCSSHPQGTVHQTLSCSQRIFFVFKVLQAWIIITLCTHLFFDPIHLRLQPTFDEKVLQQF